MAWQAPSHYLNQCWNVVNCTLRNKFQCNFNWNSNIFIQENALEYVVCEMASILSRPQCVNNSSTKGKTKVRVVNSQRYHINGLVQGRSNSSALAMELRLSCINPLTSLWVRYGVFIAGTWETWPWCMKIFQYHEHLQFSKIVRPSTVTKMSFWCNFHHWLNRTVSKWQLLVNPVTEINKKMAIPFQSHHHHTCWPELPYLIWPELLSHVMASLEFCLMEYAARHSRGLSH